MSRYIIAASFLILAMVGIVGIGEVSAKADKQVTEANVRSEMAIKEANTILGFRSQFGGVEIVDRLTLKEVEVIAWQSDRIHAALNIGGIWLELPAEMIQTGNVSK